VSLAELVTNYGYIIIVIGTFFEGETILIVAGFLAHGGYLQLPYVIIAGFAGTFIGDQLYFYVGCIKEKKFIDHKPLWKLKADRVLKLLEKHQTWLILGFRFLYGVRTVTPFVLGASGISPINYGVLNLFGGLMWTILVGVLGYYFGHAVEFVLIEIKSYEKWVILGLILSSIAVWIVYKWREKKHSTSPLHQVFVPLAGEGLYFSKQRK
jgi:membrane protein DedA with SNARE-associated domain